MTLAESTKSIALFASAVIPQLLQSVQQERARQQADAQR
jgi:hypothetical protein